jgi:bifunctional non-homologous end joining protein LigD
MLPTPGGVPANPGAYAFEFKWDGMRAIVESKAGQLSIMSRNQNPQVERFPELAGLAGLGDVVLDGEIVVLDADGRPDFARLQNRFNLNRRHTIAEQAGRHPAHFIVFDVLSVGGRDVRRQSYADRRRILLDLGLNGDRWAVTPSIEGDAAAMQAVVRDRDLEGMVAKRLDSAYRAGRRGDAWVKVRNRARQEFVAGAWVEGERPGSFGGLLVGCWHDGALRFKGCVDTGFTRPDVRLLRTLAKRWGQDASPFDVELRGAHYLVPGIVVEAEFNGLTGSGLLRQPSFKGFRLDKAAEDVVWEQA